MSAETKPLHVFGDDCEWVIAHDLEDAQRVYEEHVGAPVEDQSDRWSQEPDDASMICCVNADETEVAYDGDDGSHDVTRTWAEWAAWNGRGFFGATKQ